MIRDRSTQQPEDANDYAAAFTPSRKARLRDCRIKRLLTVLVALSALIFVPISADATLYVIVLDEQEIAIASDGKWLTASSEHSTPMSKIPGESDPVGPPAGSHVRRTHGNRHLKGENPCVGRGETTQL
jgi:hypothetical protein